MDPSAPYWQTSALQGLISKLNTRLVIWMYTQGSLGRSDSGRDTSVALTCPTQSSDSDHEPELDHNDVMSLATFHPEVRDRAA